MNPYSKHSLPSLAEQLKRCEISPVELLEASLASVRQNQARTNAYVCLTDDYAQQTARRAERELASGHWRGPLHGVPVAIKDNMDMAGVVTTASSRLLQNNIAASDSAIVTLLKQAGAVIVGKTRLHEFAFGGITPECRNPWDDTCITGGSSGGSAATVATDDVPLALGTDTAGSVRLPAALCGVTGFKPTRDRISIRGIIPLSPTLDHVGVITRDVAAAALAMTSLAAPSDAAPQAAQWDAMQERGVRDLRIGVPENPWCQRTVAGINAGIEVALQAMADAGARPISVALDDAATYNRIEYTIVQAQAHCYHKDALANTPEMFISGVLHRLRKGATLLASDYVQAMWDRQALQASFARLFSEVDVIITPTVPVTAIPLTPEVEADQYMMQWDDGTHEPYGFALSRFTTFANIAGLPALSVPCGFADNGLPVGMQIVGPAHDDALVLQVGQWFQQMTDWHTRRPTS